MDYKTKTWSVEELVELATKCNPNLIIGSSMGGYFADVLGSHTRIEVLLFNPALHSSSVDYTFKDGKEDYQRTIILGMQDTVVIPERTKEMAIDTAKIVEMADMGHRTPLDTFKSIYTQLFADKTT